ncbi:hypothetical protein [Subtercola sp. YIM 133946]|uniref:hypothetical protein n=1 Tax=Subtercola sp. YIM 133946 TaxID=3118909 RepID=UPI002F951F3C
MKTSTHTAFGPRAITANDIRGIRYLMPPDDNNGDGGGGGDEKKFSQADVDRITGERLAREQKKYEGFDDFKAKAEKWVAHEATVKPKDDDKSKDDDKPSGPSDEDVQKRIDDALKAERVRSGSKLVSLELDKALADRVVEPSKLLGFDRTEYVTSEGDVDKSKLAEWVKENTTESQAPRPRRDPSQGQRDSSANGGSVQSGRDEYEKRHGKKQQ